MSTRIVANVGIVSIASVVQLILQFALQVVLARRFGAGAVIDAFNAGLVIPTVLTTIITVSLGYVLIPILSAKFAEQQSIDQAWGLAATVGGWVVAFSVAVAIVLSIGAPLVVGILFPGFDAATRATTIRVLAWLAWQFPLGTITSWMQSVQNSQHRFLWPATTAAVGALINLVCAVRWVEHGILGYAQAIIFSSVVHAALLVLPSIVPIVRSARWRHPELGKLLRTWAPLLAGSIYLRLDPLFDRVFGSFLAEGNIAQLGYAQKFIAALLAISSGGILTVIFPQLGAVSLQSPEVLVHRLRRSMHGLLLILVPVILGAGLFAHSVTRDLLQRGEFSAEDTRAVARLFQILLLFFASASLADLFARAFYAIGDTRTPTVLGAIGLTLGLLAKYWLSLHFDAPGIAWSNAGYFALTTIALAIALQYRIGTFWTIRDASVLIKPTVASLLCCAIAFGIERMVPYWGTFFAAPIAAACYPIILVVLREPLAREIAMGIRDRFRN